MLLFKNSNLLIIEDLCNFKEENYIIIKPESIILINEYYDISIGSTKNPSQIEYHYVIPVYLTDSMDKEDIINTLSNAHKKENKKKYFISNLVDAPTLAILENGYFIFSSYKMTNFEEIKSKGKEGYRLIKRINELSSSL